MEVSAEALVEALVEAVALVVAVEAVLLPPTIRVDSADQVGDARFVLGIRYLRHLLATVHTAHPPDVPQPPLDSVPQSGPHPTSTRCANGEAITL